MKPSRGKQNQKPERASDDLMRVPAVLDIAIIVMAFSFVMSATIYFFALATLNCVSVTDE